MTSPYLTRPPRTRARAAADLRAARRKLVAAGARRVGVIDGFLVPLLDDRAERLRALDRMIRELEIQP